MKYPKEKSHQFFLTEKRVIICYDKKKINIVGYFASAEPTEGIGVVPPTIDFSPDVL